MNKFSLFVASLFMSVASFAQWIEPSAPAVAPLAVGQELYLYNLEADGFFVGANEWGTRASYSQTLGNKVKLEAAEDGYIVRNAKPGSTDFLPLYVKDNAAGIWVDESGSNTGDHIWTFNALDGGYYTIGLSSTNEQITTTDYPNACLGAVNDPKDTRLYIIDPEGEYDYETAMLTWYFVTPANYDAYVKAVSQYNAAMALEGAIELGESLGVDVTAAKAVYNNTSSTTEQLTAAKVALDELNANAGFAAASVEKPYQIAFYDFSDPSDAEAWTSTVSAQNKGAANGNNAADYEVTGNHYENWHPSNFSLGGEIYATVKDMPIGVYHLNALAFTSSGDGVQLFVDRGIAPVKATKIDVEQPTDAYSFLLEKQDIKFGLQVEANKMNWVGLDNVSLEYLGASKEAYTYVKNLVIENTPDFETMIDEGAYYQKSIYEAFKQAQKALNDAVEPAEIANAIDAYDKLSAELSESMDAYGKYYGIYQDAEEWLGGNTADNETIDALTDYLQGDEAEGYNGNGGGAYILENCLLTTEQILAEATYIEKLFNDARAAGLADGDICTQLLKNPDFSEPGGWNAAQGIEWPLGIEDFRAFEAWGKVCDVHQELSGLQNGIYEMNLQAAYKTDGDEDIRRTYAYLNDFKTLIPVAAEESVDEATKKFAEGAYPVKVYGLVTDGNLRVGITNELRTGEQGRLWAGGVSLIYRAKNAEACASLTATLTEQANSLKDAIYGNEESEALADAVSAAQGAEDGYNALKALKSALDDANEGVNLYSTLNVAVAGLEDAIANNPNADAMIVANAEIVLTDAKSAYAGKSYNNEEVAKAIEDVNAASVAVKLGKVQATEDNPVDMSSAIVNNNFDPAKGSKDEKRIDGWVVSGALNGYKEFSCSFNKGTFDLHQDLSGLPKGKYKVTVHTYYRAGSYEEEAANITAGKDTHLMKLYANDQETSVMNLSEGSKGVTLPDGIGTKEINGIIVPDGTGSSVKCYAAGLFLNELVFTVGEDGKATIGLKLDQTIGTNDYTVVGEWNLWYMGDNSATEQDMTNLIVNNDFDPAKGNKDEKRIDGWVVSGALNGYKQYSCSFNKGTFDLHQDLSGLPAGKYKATVNTYYRAGSYEEEAANITAGKDTHLMKLYANTSNDNYEKSVMNLSEGSKGVTLPDGIGTKEINGIIVPDGTGSSVACYEAGLFLNEIEFVVGADGKATIGLKLDQTIGTNDYTVVGPWHLYYYGAPKDLEEQKVTSLIVNNDFDPAKGSKDEKRIDGWVVSGALNGYKSNTCSFNKGTFDLHQDLSGLPEGTYTVTVHTYYRAGSYEEEAANITAGKDTHLMKLYTNTADKNYETSVMNLSEGSKDVTLPDGISTKEINGIIVPDGTGASVACYAEGLFLNRLTFYVGADGKATIGLKLDQTIGTNDYTVVGEWNLYYYGSGNNIEQAVGIEDAEIAAEATPVAIYSISGARVAGLQKGINIIKMSNGQVKKIFVE